MAPIAAVRYPQDHRQEPNLRIHLLTLSTKEIETCTSEPDTGGLPCEKHASSIGEKYAAKLEALGCLCRALLALGQESCCVRPQKSSLERKHR